MQLLSCSIHFSRPHSTVVSGCRVGQRRYRAFSSRQKVLLDSWSEGSGPRRAGLRLDALQPLPTLPCFPNNLHPPAFCSDMQLMGK